MSCTQIGKSRMGAKFLLSLAWVAPWSLFWWCAPVGHQTEPGFREIGTLLRERGVPVKTKEHPDSAGPRSHTIWPGVLNAKIEYRSWEREENLGGSAVDGMVVDEAQELTRRAHGQLSARRSATLGPMLYLGNASYESSEFNILRRRAESEGPAGGLYLEAWTWRDYAAVLPPRERALYEAFIKSEFKRLGEEEASRLYEAKDLLLGSGLIDLGRVCTNGGDALNPVAMPYFEPWDDEPCIAGLDLGDLQNWSVLYIIGQETGRVKGLDRFKGLGWRPQAERIVEACRRYCRLRDDKTQKPGQEIVLIADATGLGGPVGQMIEESAAGTAIELRPTTIDNVLKRRMVERIQAATQGRWISMPWVAECVQEAEMLERVPTPTGAGFTYRPGPGFHDDSVWALGLALYGKTRTIMGVIS